MDKARLVSRTARITLDGPIETVFPLFGPLKEREWALGWEPRIIFSDRDEVQEHTIFLTEGHPPHEDHYTWIVSQYKPKDYFIEYTVFTQERVWFIRIVCRNVGERKTQAEVTYTYIGLSELGNRLNEEALAHIFYKDLSDWGEAINHYLETGKRLTHH